MDCVGFASCKASSSLLLLVQSAQGDLILQGQRQIIRACIIFLLCMGRAVKPSLRGINWLCEGCCRHLQIVPEGVSAVCSLCTTVSILLPTQLLMSNKPSQTQWPTTTTIYYCYVLRFEVQFNNPLLGLDWVWFTSCLLGLGPS